VSIKKSNGLMTTAQAADFLSLPAATLKWWRVRNQERGPRYFRLHQHCIRYSLSDLQQWLRKRRVGAGRIGGKTFGSS
jgi:hypothetical protein